jgi:hypothetical protein
MDGRLKAIFVAICIGDTHSKMPFGFSNSDRQVPSTRGVGRSGTSNVVVDFGAVGTMITHAASSEYLLEMNRRKGQSGKWYPNSRCPDLFFIFLWLP